MEKYLRPREYYVDLYDRQTVNLCRDLERIGLEIDIPSTDGKEKTDEEMQRAQIAFNELHLHFVTGERYTKKYEEIEKWMERDKARDRLYETASAPENIRCLTCSRLMFTTSKHFLMGCDKEVDRVLFFYDCPSEHTPRRAIYNDGEEFKREKPQCPKCDSVLNEEDKTTEEKFITIETCSKCGYTNTREIERTTSKEMHDLNYERDRVRFCSDEEGQKYADWMRTAHELTEVLEKHKEKEQNKELYEAVAKIKKLKIIELEQLLAPILETASYIKFHLREPEITRDVAVPFTVHDCKEGREEWDSRHNLQKLLKKALEGTNWRLMSDGVSYRLGMLDGRFRAYEKEEDLVKLVQQK